MEEKIKEIAQNTREKIKDFSLYKNPDTGNNALDLTGMREIIEDALKEYGVWVRQQTLEEVRKCVPRENDKSSGKDFEKMILGYFTLGFNDCRQQTLENIDKLSTPSSNK